MRGGHERGHLQAKDRALRRDKPRDAWILAFQPPELGENEILPSKPLGLWYSVVAALAI